MELYDQAALSATILIVDDQAFCGLLIKRLLESAGYTRCTALTDPLEAISRFQEIDPDLVLLDLHMETLSGVEVLEKIALARPEKLRPQILVMTGDTSIEAKHEALAAGATDFLSKPFDDIEVLLRIRNLLHARALYQRCQVYSSGLERLVERRTDALQQNAQALEGTIRELRETQHQVVQQERSRVLGTMACGFAHDLNNGLSLILGYGDLMLSYETQFPEGSLNRRYLESIVRAGYDNAQLVKRLRDFYRPNDALDEHQPMNLNAMTEQVITMTAPKWQTEAQAKGAYIEMKTELAELPILSGAPAEIREVLTNLIFNAVDALPHGGVITFTSSVETDFALLKVSDTGDGMDAETLQNCFEPFFTTKGADGTGLGLPMCQGIVVRHGGTLQVESTPGVGTTFSIRLPIPSSLLLEELPFITVPGVPLHVLVVDDNEGICEVVEAYLKEEGHTVETAFNATEALRKLEASEFNLVITDLAMPHINGDELTNLIKARSPLQPVIMLTGFSDIVKDAGTKADCLLKKPARRIDIRGAIRKATAGQP